MPVRERMVPLEDIFMSCPIQLAGRGPQGHLVAEEQLQGQRLFEINLQEHFVLGEVGIEYSHAL